jgi:thioredoxin-dependent peroxiredoxin
VCTKQFCSYRDEADLVAGLDAELVGISPQGVESHERFLAEHQLTVPLLSDTEKRVASDYGVLGPGGFVRRAIFIVDPEGVIRHRHVATIGVRFMSAEEIGRHLNEVRAPA